MFSKFFYLTPLRHFLRYRFYSIWKSDNGEGLSVLSRMSFTNCWRRIGWQHLPTFHAKIWKNDVTAPMSSHHKWKDGKVDRKALKRVRKFFDFMAFVHRHSVYLHLTQLSTFGGELNNLMSLLLASPSVQQESYSAYATEFTQVMEVAQQMAPEVLNETAIGVKNATTKTSSPNFLH